MDNLIVVGGCNITNVSAYSYKDVGRKADRKQFVYDPKAYLFDKGYAASWKDLQISGQALIADCDTLQAAYEAGASVSVTDMYGKSYSTAFILSFDLGYVKASGVRTFNMQLLMTDGNTFKIDGTVTYGIESCTISDRGNRASVVEAVDGSIGFNVKTYTNRLFTIQMAGVELASSPYSDTLGNGLITLTTPDGEIFKAVITDRQYSLIEGTSQFRQFSMSMIASKDLTIQAVQDLSTPLIESYTINDLSFRGSKHRTIGGLVIQKFANVEEIEYSINYLIGKTVDDSDRAIGATPVITGGPSVIMRGLVVDKNISNVQDGPLVHRVSVKMLKVE